MIEELHHRDRCAIVGIGETDYSRNSGRSDLTLATEAALAAVADAGLRPDEIDGVVRCDMDTVYHHDLVESIGMPNVTYWAEVGPGGVAAAGMVGQAVGAILSGQATTVLVFRELNGRSGQRYGMSSATVPAVGGGGTYDELYMPYGLLTPGQVFAMFAQRHMIEFGTTPEQLGQIPITCRKRANANPRAQMHDRLMTIDDYLGVADDLDATADVRLLSRDRRRVRSRGHSRRASQGPPTTPGAHPRRGPSHHPESAAGDDVSVAGSAIDHVIARDGCGRRAVPPGRPRTC